MSSFTTWWYFTKGRLLFKCPLTYCCLCFLFHLSVVWTNYISIKYHFSSINLYKYLNKFGHQKFTTLHLSRTRKEESNVGGDWKGYVKRGVEQMYLCVSSPFFILLKPLVHRWSLTQVTRVQSRVHSTRDSLLKFSNWIWKSSILVNCRLRLGPIFFTICNKWEI